MSEALKEIFSDKMINNLNELKEDEIYNLSINDLVKKLQEIEEIKALPDGWKYENKILSMNIKDANKSIAELFLDINETIENLASSNEIKVSLDYKDGVKCCRLEIEGLEVSQLKKLQEEVTKVKLALSNTAEMQDRIELSFEGIIDCFSELEKGDYLVKIPIAQVGEWKHPMYGSLNYTEETLRTLKRNIDRKVIGFEAPLFKGHPRDIEGGAPAEGYLVKNEIQNGILYGTWLVNKDVYREIQDGKYRYSSSEFVTEFKDKQSGKEVGMVLVGMALTNRPFIPNLPKVTVLEDLNLTKDQITMVTFDYNGYNDKCMETKEENMTLNTDEVKLSESTVDKESNQDYKQIFRDEINEKIKFVENTYKQQLTEVIKQNELLQERIAKFEQVAEEQELQKKLEYINGLGLPSEVKEQYSELVKEKKLGVAEETVLQSLQTLASVMHKPVLQQYGQSQQTDNLNSLEFEDPYKEVVARNLQLAQQLKSR